MAPRAPASCTLVPPAESLGRNARKVTRHHSPVSEHLPRRSDLPVAARRGHRLLRPDDEAARLPKTQHEVEIVAEGQVPESPRPLVGRATAEDPLVAERQA